MAYCKLEWSQSDTYIGAISQEMPQTQIHLKITYLNFHSNSPGGNELNSLMMGKHLCMTLFLTSIQHHHIIIRLTSSASVPTSILSFLALFTVMITRYDYPYLSQREEVIVYGDTPLLGTSVPSCDNYSGPYVITTMG